MIGYSPFEKPLKQLETANLVMLTQAAEGWYIEYKRDIPNASSIAKSVSAFANTYGGWLFYGVQEKSKEEPVAGAFPGIASTEVEPSIQRMRQAIAAHLAPAPHFETNVFRGPCDLIGLPDGRAIICAQVPWSPATPHVHKTGVIYRRVGDSSEPRMENDRFILDQLWRRGDDLRKQYTKWLEKDPELSKAERERPYARLLLVTDLWQDRNLWLDLSIQEVREIMGETRGVVTSVPFDTVYTSANGFIGRQCRNNDPQELGMTWRLWPDLASEIIIPLNLHDLRDVQAVDLVLDGYEGVADFSSALRKHGHRTPRILDLNLLFNILVGIVEIQTRFLRHAGWSDAYFAKTSLLNVWRTCPFVDVKAILKGFDAHGIPMCLDGTITSPAGTEPDTFTKVPLFQDVTEETARIFLQALWLFAPIARAFGLPVWVDISSENEDPPYFLELQRAGQRAIKVQQTRNQRLA